MYPVSQLAGIEKQTKTEERMEERKVLYERRIKRLGDKRVVKLILKKMKSVEVHVIAGRATLQ